MSPLRVCLGWPQRLAVLRHVQDVGVQFRSHEQADGRTKRKWESTGADDGCEVRQLQKRRTSEHERRSRRGESGVWRGERRGEDDEWDGRLRDTTPVLLPISLSRANSGKDGGINYWSGEKRRREELAIPSLEVQEHINKLSLPAIMSYHLPPPSHSQQLHGQRRPLVSRFLFNSFLRPVSQTLWFKFISDEPMLMVVMMKMSDEGQTQWKDDTTWRLLCTILYMQ